MWERKHIMVEMGEKGWYNKVSKAFFSYDMILGEPNDWY